jgi:hypothetical protein
MSKHSMRSGSASSPSASCSPSSASTRCWRRRSAFRRSWSRASSALRSASSRIRRLSPRSAARTSTLAPRRGPRGPDHLPHFALDRVLQVEGLAVGEHAVADLEDLRVGVGPVDGDGDDVDRPDRLVGHALALEQRAHGAQAVALERRLLVLARDRRRLHLLLEVALDLAVAPGEEGHDAVDRLVVLLARDVADAGRPAALDVVVQARRARAPPRLDALAGTEEEDLAQQVERAAHALGVRVGPEVDAVAAVALAREVDAREFLVHRDRDERIGLVVAQADVEARAVLLDEVLLGQQRLGLGGDEHELHPVDRVDHLVGAARDRVGEVAGHPLLQRLGLADIDDLALVVAEQVDARPVGQRLALLGQAGPATLGGSRRLHLLFEDTSR